MKKKRRSRQYRDNSKVIDMDAARKKRQARRQADRAANAAKAQEDTGRKLKRKQEMRKKQNRRRMVIALIILLVMAVLSFSVIHIIQLKHEQNLLMKQQQELIKEKEELQESIKNVDDEERIEDQARSKLKMVKPGETIYIPDGDLVTNEEENEDN